MEVGEPVVIVQNQAVVTVASPSPAKDSTIFGGDMLGWEAIPHNLRRSALLGTSWPIERRANKALPSIIHTFPVSALLDPGTGVGVGRREASWAAACANGVVGSVGIKSTQQFIQ